MKDNIKIALIGGTGKSGRYLVRELVQRGYQLKALVRNPDNFNPDSYREQSPLIEVVYGDVRDYEKVKLLVEGCDVVLSTLGGTLSEPTVFSQATRHILNAMSEFDIKRYILVAGLNVDTPFDKKGPATQAATEWMYTNFPESTKDRQYEYELLVESHSDWTLVRLPLIIMTDERLETKTSLEDCLGDKISATDLADFLIEQIEDKSFVGKAPFLFNR